jgi:hypothetical protein
MRPVALAKVNFAFDFVMNPEGILVVLTADLSDKMLLDYSEDRVQGQMLELEISGPHWGPAEFSKRQSDPDA